jgi:hypothetical protein
MEFELTKYWSWALMWIHNDENKDTIISMNEKRTDENKEGQDGIPPNVEPVSMQCYCINREL